MEQTPTSRSQNLQNSIVWCLASLVLLALLLLTAATVITIENLGHRVLPTRSEAIKNIRHESGHLYVSDLSTDEYSQTTGASIALVLENGKPLPHKNIEHSLIRSLGAGRFSFWNKEIYFSASDNTDPTQNSREYVALFPVKIPTWVTVSTYTLTGLILLLLFGCTVRFRTTLLQKCGLGRYVEHSPVVKRARAASELIWKWRDVICCACIIALTLFVRWNTSLMIQTGGDATNYWAISALLSSGDGISSWHHKSARFGILIPVTLVQLVLGYEPINYYVAPLLFWMILTPLTYLTGKQIANRSVGLLAALSLLAFSQLDECASQILPSIFETVYLLLTFYLLTFVEPGKKGTLILLFAILAFFLGYGAKETNIFFLPGVCLFLWVRTRSLARPIQFGVAVCLLIAAETAFYYYYAGIPRGRLGVMAKSHLEVMTNVEPSFRSLVGRLFTLPTEWLYVYGAFVVACLNIPFSRRARAVGGMAIGVFSFVVLMLCAVKKLDPITPAVRFLPRYMDVTAPLVALVVFNAIYAWVKQLLTPAARVMQIDSTILARGAAMIVVLLIPISAASRFQNTPFEAVRHYSSLIERSLAEGRPIVMLEEKANRTLDRLLVGAYRTPLHYETVPLGTRKVYVAATSRDLITQEKMREYVENGTPITLLNREPLEVIDTSLTELARRES